MKIIHTADWHVDANIKEARRCLQYLVAEAERIKPDLVTITGDIWNSASVHLDSAATRLVARTVWKLKEIATHGVVILIGTPSHDGLASKVFDTIPKVEVIDTPRSIIYDAQPGHPYSQFLVSGLPQPTKQYLESIAHGDIDDVNLAMSEALTGVLGGFGDNARKVDGPHICLGHFSVRGCKISPTQQLIGYDIEMSSYQLEMAQPTLWCLGHIHHPQEVAERVFYSGSIYRVDFGERDSVPGFWQHNLVTALDEVRQLLIDVQSIRHNTPATTMSKISIDAADINNPDEIDYMIDADEAAEKMQIEVKTWADLADTIDVHLIKENAVALGAKQVDIIIVRVPRPNVRSAKVLAADRLRDKIQARAEIVDDKINQGILDKADMVESMGAEEVVKAVKSQFVKGVE